MFSEVSGVDLPRKGMKLSCDHAVLAQLTQEELAAVLTEALFQPDGFEVPVRGLLIRVTGDEDGVTFSLVRNERVAVPDEIVEQVRNSNVD